jgi:predicted RNA-binding protein with EMAP domain
VSTEQVTVTVTSVNVGGREVTLQLPDGTSKTVKVGDKVDLAKVRPCDNVTAQVSEGLAL